MFACGWFVLYFVLHNNGIQLEMESVELGNLFFEWELLQERGKRRQRERNESSGCVYFAVTRLWLIPGRTSAALWWAC